MLVDFMFVTANIVESDYFPMHLSSISGDNTPIFSSTIFHVSSTHCWLVHIFNRTTAMLV